MGIEHVVKVLKLIVKAVNDGSNAAGDDSSPVEKLSAFGSLIPDIIGVIPSLKHLPAELKDLDLSEGGQLVQAVSSELDLPGERADSIVKSGADAYNLVVPAIVSAVQLVSGTVKKEAVEPKQG